MWITLPAYVPAGGYLASIVVGAASGRLIGEALQQTETFQHIHPGLFAVIGASGFACGVYHLLSSILLLIEWSGDTQHSLPALLVCLISLSIAKQLQLSYWDKSIYDTKLPYLPEIKGDHHYTAKDVLENPSYFVSVDPSLEEMTEILKNSCYTAYPVVDDKQTRRLTGRISYEDLYEYFLRKYYDTFNNNKESISDAVHMAAITLENGESIDDKNFFDPTLPPNALALKLRKDTPNLVHQYEIPRMKVDPIPWIRVSSETPLEEVHTLFVALFLKTLFVVDLTGRLTGVITREKLALFEGEGLNNFCFKIF